MESSILRVLQFLDGLSISGIAHAIDAGLLREFTIDDAFHVIAEDQSVAEVVAHQILHCVGDTFVNTSVAKFEGECCDADGGDIAAALERLATEFYQASTLLHHCSHRLLPPEFVVGVAHSSAASHGLSLSFATKVRSTLLEEGLMSKTPTQESTRRLLSFLDDHARRLLEVLESDPVNGCLSLTTDKSLIALHKMGLARSQWVQEGWMAVLFAAVEQRLEALDDDGSQPQVVECLRWKEAVVDPLVRAIVLGPRHIITTTSHAAASHGGTANGPSGELRSEVDRVCSELEQHLFTMYCRRRMSTFFDLIVEFPSSLPALQDVRYCLLRTVNGRALLAELIAHVKRILAARLHRPGTGTESILTVLVCAIRSLCVVLHKNEQSSGVFAVVGDTLKHLRDRKDSVAAVVQDITEQDTDASVLYSDLVAAQSSHPAGADDDSDDDATGGDVAHPSSVPSTGRRPDVLRVLLSTLSAHTIVDQFRAVLAQRILTKPMHGYDTLDEEEVLERIRCVFGEDLLSACTVMVRDVQASRRLNTRIREKIAAAPASRSIDVPMSATILSTSCWPNASGLSQLNAEPPIQSAAAVPFEPHPMLAGHMQQYAEQFQLLKPNQRLLWMTQLGRVTIRLPQKKSPTGTPLEVPHTLGLLSASIALYLRGGVKTLGALSSELKCDVALVQQRVVQHHPVVFVFRAETGTVYLQPLVVTASTFQFDDDGNGGGGGSTATGSSQADDAGVPPQELAMIQNTITAMLKARAASKTAAEIHNSLKMFLKYAGSLQDLKRVLQYLVGQGKLSTLDGTTYSLPKQ